MYIRDSHCTVTQIISVYKKFFKLLFVTISFVTMSKAVKYFFNVVYHIQISGSHCNLIFLVFYFHPFTDRTPYHFV